MKVNKLRPVVFTIVVALSAGMLYGMAVGMVEAAMSCIVGICALGPKLIESDT